jgi:hypothetical protein
MRPGWVALAASFCVFLSAGCGDDGTGPDVKGAPPASVIESVLVEGDPILPFPSDGDLWMSTWADDGNLYSTWGDGLGVAPHATRTDCGIARFSGSLPAIGAEERATYVPTADPAVDDKPSSLVCIAGRLYGYFHSPLGDAWIGYVAWSDDHGATWTRAGFYEEGEALPTNPSPWTRDVASRFRCLFAINMGRDYELDDDGHLYALGIGREWAWFGGVCLARVPTGEIADYSAYTYYAGDNGGRPVWSVSQDAAVPLAGLQTTGQGSAMYHPGIGRYLFLTARELFEAPRPWGPWTSAGVWTNGAPIEWQGGYQPGIISKDTGPDSFWFTIAGRETPPMMTYRLHLGLMRMRIRDQGASAPVPR